MAWDLTFLCSARECQAINPYCAWLQFQLSRCGAVLWITLKSWRGALCFKDTETERQTICPGRNCVGLEKTHILLAKRYLSIRGENSVIRNVNTWIKLPPWVFSIYRFLSFSLSFVLVPFWCIPSLIWLWRREAIENLVERVFMVDSVVRWLSQRRMLIRQPRLRLIWLAAVTPSSCSQSAPHLLPPLCCSTASFLSLCIFFLVFLFTFETTSSHPVLVFLSKSLNSIFSFHHNYYGYHFIRKGSEVEIWGLEQIEQNWLKYTISSFAYYFA